MNKKKIVYVAVTVLVAILAISNVWFFMGTEDLKSQVTYGETEIVHFNDVIETLKTEAVQRDTEVFDRDRQIDSLEGQITSLNNQIEDLNNSLEAKIVELNGWIDDRETEIENLYNRMYSKDVEIRSLQDQLNAKDNAVRDLQKQLDTKTAELNELKAPKLEENIRVMGWEWITTENGERWQERVTGTITNKGLGTATDVTLIIRWYLKGEFLYIRQVYHRQHLTTGDVWTIKQFFEFDQQPDSHEVELSWK